MWDQWVDYLLLSSVMLVVLGVFLRISLRLLYGARGPAPDDSIDLFMRILSWSLLLAPGAILMAVTFNWLSLVLLAAMVEALFEVVMARRSSQRQAAWRLALSAMGGGRPAIESLHFHEPRFTGVVGRWYRRLIADLEHGVPWNAAIRENSGALPREAPAYAALIGGSAESAREVYEFDESRDAAFLQVRQAIVQRFAYLGTVVAAMIAVITFVMIKIAPAYEEIFTDFGLTQPIITQSFYAFVELMIGGPALPILGCVAIFVVAALVVGLLYLCDLRPLDPLFDWLGVARHRAHVMRLLAAAIAQRMPLREALLQLYAGAASYPSGYIRSKLGRALTDVEAGGQWQAALQAAGLVSSTDAAALRASESAGNLPWTLRLLADRKLRATAFRWSAVQHVAYTALVLLMGLFMLWFSVAMFVPIVDMIYQLSV